MRAEKAEIIAVGTELLLGQIANTNAQWISKELAALGLPVYSHTVVGDNMDRVRTCFKAAGARSDIIIVTGGLGPTEDDLTRDAAQEIFGQELVEHEPSMVKILAVFERNGRPMTLNNRKQSHVFQQAEVLTNSKGMAPGQIVEHEGTIWVFLPGVPSEMKALMEEEVLPKLRERFEWKSQIVSEMMRFIGIGESRLETELSDLISTQTNPTIAPLASEGEVGLRLTATGETDAEALQSIEALKEKILERVGGHYYGSDAVTIEEKVKQLLESRNYTIGSAESFTGGMFMENLVALPGASAVCEGGIVSYTPAAKEQVLQVPSFIIKEFGTISHECAEVMALNAQAILRTDIGISFTGVAGPEESEGKAPGTVYIGLQIGERKPEVHELYFHGAREQVRHRAVKKGFELLFQRLK
ncbi:UNVERIFIED_CONTAM: competence/damage-inducible protein A [Halobacillus marinus]|uniref:competence/damage-inducible protein A n=1 Tax=Bacillaceae TaxID=186817 RepID=UPI0003FA7586|nr:MULTISPECIES: competence/damage-inducible protein A [Bacillaceae]QHT46724.1 competence/damage-inducible protein A [Bacillus sp. SB49]